MADKTGIEWTDATWNPTLGCSLVSPGCTNCYAMTMAARIEAMGTAPHYAGLTKPGKAGAVWTGTMRLAPQATLTLPLRWRRGRRIFVNSMSDLFHEDVPDDWIDRVFAVMALTPQHTYQILTKRSARMRNYFLGPVTREQEIGQALLDLGREIGKREPLHNFYLPLPNVWLGVSAEDQRRADERIPDLLATPAAIRFVSAEPLLGPIDFKAWFYRGDHGLREIDPLAASMLAAGEDDGSTWIRPALDQIIVGGESGKGARPMHPDWARSIRDQCTAAGTAFFFKQWGEWFPQVDRERDDPDWRLDYSHRFSVTRKDVSWLNAAGGRGFHGERFHVMGRVGKRAAGRLLDGVEHNAMPEVRR